MPSYFVRQSAAPRDTELDSSLMMIIDHETEMLLLCPLAA